MLFLGEYTTACRVLRDEFLIDGPVHSVGNEAVYIAYRFGRQAFWLVLRFFSLYSAALAHAVVELLQVVCGELVQFDCSDRNVFDLLLRRDAQSCCRLLVLYAKNSKKSNSEMITNKILFDGYAMPVEMRNSESVFIHTPCLPDKYGIFAFRCRHS